MLAACGAEVVMACRNTAKAERAAAEIRTRTPGAGLEVRALDLADLDSVAAFADGLDGPLDLLVNNAGLMAVDESRTVQGFETPVRRQPPRALRAHRPTDAAAARDARLANRDHVEHGPPARARHRRPPPAAPLPALAGLPVHRRTAPPAHRGLRTDPSPSPPTPAVPAPTWAPKGAGSPTGQWPWSSRSCCSPPGPAPYRCSGRSPTQKCSAGSSTVPASWSAAPLRRSSSRAGPPRRGGRRRLWNTSVELTGLEPAVTPA